MNDIYETIKKDLQDDSLNKLEGMSMYCIVYIFAVVIVWFGLPR